MICTPYNKTQNVPVTMATLPLRLNRSKTCASPGLGRYILIPFSFFFPFQGLEGLLLRCSTCFQEDTVYCVQYELMYGGLGGVYLGMLLMPRPRARVGGKYGGTMSRYDLVK